MSLYTKESLEKLRERIDLLEVISAHVDLKRMGATYKGLCPFHEEKTPSFIMQKSDSHYHCFGCGAHGDAIQFLMNYSKIPFTEAVEALAEKFQVVLQRIDRKEERGVDKALLREALDSASLFFHVTLLHTQEGSAPLNYLLARGITTDFIQRFEIGFAPKEQGLLRKVMGSRNISEEVLLGAGLLTKEGKKEFFQERITFPIRNAKGSVIGFSARKIREETYGGKYINTSETPLFKKSRILFGLNYSRERIAKERRAIIVEGQIDCLKMIESGFNFTIASLGTAFGVEHVKELQNLNVQTVTLLFDGDDAGQNASSKAGDLFQKAGIAVKICLLPQGFDPDSYLRKYGVDPLKQEIQNGIDYIEFQVRFLSKSIDINTPAGKAELVRKIAVQIRNWDEPVMVHESLRRLCQLTHVPEDVVGVSGAPLRTFSRPHLGSQRIDTDRILEMDLIRWLLLTGEENREIVELARRYLEGSFFSISVCRHIFELYMAAFEHQRPCDLLSLGLEVQDENVDALMEEILSKKINREKAKQHALATVQQLLDRKWLEEKEKIKKEIESATHEEERLILLKQFDQLNANRVICKF